MSQNEYLLMVWVTITVLAVAGMIAVLVWAIRSHQFGQQDRARSLALESGIPSEPISEPRTGVSGPIGKTQLGNERSEDEHVLQ